MLSRSHCFVVTTLRSSPLASATRSIVYQRIPSISSPSLRRSFVTPSAPVAFRNSPTARMPATAETASWRFNHTMIRVKDPEKSLKFYTEILGMDLIDEHDAGDFKLFFLAFNLPSQKDLKRGEREGILELTWNKGTEKDDKFAYHNGNDQPQGFGHTCIAVDDLEKAVARFDKYGVEFKKRPEDGKMRNIAFIFDPDKYWIEVISHGKPQ